MYYGDLDYYLIDSCWKNYSSIGFAGDASYSVVVA